MNKVTNTHKFSRFISGGMYIVLNAIYVASVVAIIDLFDSPWLGLLVVAISKWRIFAVRLRFWWANLTSNITDILVAVSYVFLVHAIGVEQFYYQIALAGIYLAWLLLIKPGTSTNQVATQGIISIFVSNLVLSLYGFNWPIALFLMVELVIAYNVMKHFLVNSDFENKYIRLMSGVWGMIMMELAWIQWHWMISYPFFAKLSVSQFAITSTALTFLAYKILNFMNQDFKLGRRAIMIDLLASVVFVVALIVIMMVFFSKPLIEL